MLIEAGLKLHRVFLKVDSYLNLPDKTCVALLAMLYKHDKKDAEIVAQCSTHVNMKIYINIYASVREPSS